MEGQLLLSFARILGVSDQEIVHLTHVDRQMISAWDSLAHIQLYVAASEYLGTEIEFGIFMNLRRLDEILKFVSESNENSP